MEYYICELDKSVQNKFIMEKFPESDSVEYDTSNANQVREHTILYTIESDKSSYPDVLEAPLYMVSQKVREVLELYDETAIYKKVSMINMPRKTRKQSIWKTCFPSIWITSICKIGQCNHACFVIV